MQIYMLQNLANGKVYIGQTSGKTTNRRFANHRAIAERRSTKTPSAIHLAIAKYGGWDSFGKYILQECETIEELNEAEKFWIDRYDCVAPNGYNLNKGGGGHWASAETRKKVGDAHRGKILSDELKRQISKQLKVHFETNGFSDELREKRRIGSTGRKQTVESIAKTNLAKIGIPLSDDRKRRISKSLLGKASGENSYLAKLNWESVDKIRQMLLDGVEGKKVAVMFGVTPSVISAIKVERTWKRQYRPS